MRIITSFVFIIIIIISSSSSSSIVIIIFRYVFRSLVWKSRRPGRAMGILYVCYILYVKYALYCKYLSNLYL